MSESVFASSNFTHRISNQKQFDLLQRTYKTSQGTIPHVLFLIKRKNKKVFFANSKNYDYHQSFAKTVGLLGKNNKEFFRKNYVHTNRPLHVGTISFLPKFQKYFLEFSESSRLKAKHLSETYKILKTVFFAPLYFKPNSLSQEKIRQESPKIPSLPIDAFLENKEQESYTSYQSTGMLRYFKSSQKKQDWPQKSILVFDKAPIHIQPLNGIITLEPSSPLAHIHMLARAWKIPDMYWAKLDYKKFIGKWVTFNTTKKKPVLRLATPKEILSAKKNKAPIFSLPKADLQYKNFASIRSQKAKDSIRFGAKSSNLGEISHLRGIHIPSGYSIPFHYYHHFMLQNDLYKDVQWILQNRSNKDDLLLKLRKKIISLPLDLKFVKKLSMFHSKMMKSSGCFVRSSTNAEDNPNFSGAGLYASVANVRDIEKLKQSIKVVWASVWSDRAFAARESSQMDHSKVFASVLIQRAVNADSAGVMVTKNPYKEKDQDSVFINAKHGLGIKVVNGNKVPEQVLYNGKTGAYLLLSRSNESSSLRAKSSGGIEEVKIKNLQKRVLTIELSHELLNISKVIEKHFKGKPQDIEWVVEKKRVWVVQTRPFL